MKKGHIIELAVDVILLLIGLILPLIIPHDAPILICSFGLSLCSALEIVEYIFNHQKKDALFISLSALLSVCLIAFFEMKYNFALGIGFLVFTVLSCFIKIFSLKYINVKRTRLFKVKYIFTFLFTIVGIAVSIATYYDAFSKLYLFSMLLTFFALQELFCDLITYVDEVKEVFKG